MNRSSDVVIDAGSGVSQVIPDPLSEKVEQLWINWYRLGALGWGNNMRKNCSNDHSTPATSIIAATSSRQKIRNIHHNPPLDQNVLPKRSQIHPGCDGVNYAILDA